MLAHLLSLGEVSDRIKQRPSPLNSATIAPKHCIQLEHRENAIELLGLAQKDALKLLFKQTRVKKTDTTRGHAELIVNRLGYHPLAIAEAGSYMRLRKIEFSQFMNHYNRQRKDILTQVPQMSQYRKLLNDTEKETAMNSFATWELSFQQLQSEGPINNPKKVILTLFAFFDSKDISEEIFAIYCNSKKRRDDLKTMPDPGGSLRTFCDDHSHWNSQAFVGVLTDLA
jgi:hypothetical protein